MSHADRQTAWRRSRQGLPSVKAQSIGELALLRIIAFALSLDRIRLSLCSGDSSQSCWLCLLQLSKATWFPDKPSEYFAGITKRSEGKALYSNRELFEPIGREMSFVMRKISKI